MSSTMSEKNGYLAAGDYAAKELGPRENGFVADQNSASLVYVEDLESGSVLPLSPEAEDSKSLQRRLGQAHGRVVKASLNCLLNARDAGDAALRLKKQGRHCLKVAREKLGISARTVRVYIQVASNWERIEQAINAHTLAGRSIREVLAFLKETSVANEKSVPPDAAEEQDIAAPSSLHLFCDNATLAGAIVELKSRQFEYYGVEIGCDEHGSLTFVCHGVKRGAVAATEELGSWIQVTSSEESVVSLLLKRLEVEWPNGTVEEFKGPQ